MGKLMCKDRYISRYLSRYPNRSTEINDNDARHWFLSACLIWIIVMQSCHFLPDICCNKAKALAIRKRQQVGWWKILVLMKFTGLIHMQIRLIFSRVEQCKLPKYLDTLWFLLITKICWKRFSSPSMNMVASNDIIPPSLFRSPLPYEMLEPLLALLNLLMSHAPGQNPQYILSTFKLEL